MQEQWRSVQCEEALKGLQLQRRGIKLKGRSGRRRGVKGQKKSLQLQRRGIKLKATKTHYCLPLAPLHSPIMPLPRLLCNASCGPLTPPHFSLICLLIALQRLFIVLYRLLIAL